ncbi:hypothetical protein P4T70_24110 [Bacillus mobilis]|uniref:hypothetical protein n=1 Tax=Bacillus cereus group TaxID=86661 RepID=UPI000BF5DC72|nr:MULTISPECIES: hypothetical protein [Bacillus cereus group]MDX5808719.1 hypothetical protein [Bacillus cereus group sp. BfR-BA-02730]MED0951136.1 hypothetical protein [Bacillus mobilis]PES55459.1 hypothetical protein CN515_05295 [Bacillus cereus]
MRKSPVATTLKWVTFGVEAFFAIPIVGGTFILSFLWIPLFIALLLHIATIVMCKKEGASIGGNVVGIIASVLGAIPFLGWLLHLITAIVLLIEGVRISKSE